MKIASSIAKIASALLVAMSLVFVPQAASAATDDGFSYTVNASSEAVVLGCDGTCPSSLVIPDTLGGSPVTEITTYAFDAEGITSVSVPNSVTIIGLAAFQSNAISSLTLGNSVSEIRASAFENNSLTSLVIPNSVLTIGNAAFGNNSISSLDLGTGVQTIGENAFFLNQLTSLTIPDSVTTISNGAFMFNRPTQASRLVLG